MYGEMCEASSLVVMSGHPRQCDGNLQQHIGLVTGLRGAAYRIHRYQHTCDGVTLKQPSLHKRKKMSTSSRT